MAQPFAEPCSRGIIAAQPCPRELGREIPVRRRQMVLAACVLASSMAFIDGSALTVALPALRAAFGADLISVQWVLNAYVLALASLTLIGGALADVYGKARVLAIGCVLFGLASVACALAPSAAWLIAARDRAGCCRGHRDAGQPCPDRRDLSARRAKSRHRRLGRGVGADHRRRSGPGRLAHRHVRLADGVLDQPADRAVAVAMLLVFAPEDRREPRRFDVLGAAILAAALAALAWALSQLGGGEAQATATHGRSRGSRLRSPSPSASPGSPPTPSGSARPTIR